MIVRTALWPFVFGMLVVVSPAVLADEIKSQAEVTTSHAEREDLRAKGLPVVLQRVPPLYPRKLVKHGVAGCVVVQFVVGTDGVPDQFKIVTSIPEGKFDRATLEALYHWTFEPQPAPRPLLQSFSFYVERPTGTHLHSVKSPMDCPYPEVVQVAAASADAAMGVVSGVAPYFPPEAVRQKLTGCVTVSFDVGPDGLADQYEVVASEPKGQFDKAALWGLTQSRFQSMPRPSRAAVVYHFGYVGKPAGEIQCRLPAGFSRPLERPAPRPEPAEAS